MDAPPAASPLPDVTIEGVPGRPEGFLPLGSGSTSVEESVWEDLKLRGSFVGQHQSKMGQKDHSSDSPDYHVPEAWDQGVAVVKERTCVSAN